MVISTLTPSLTSPQGREVLMTMDDVQSERDFTDAVGSVTGGEAVLRAKGNLFTCEADVSMTTAGGIIAAAAYNLLCS